MAAKERELGHSTLVAVDAIEKLVSKRLASSIFVVDSLVEELKGVSGKLKEALKQVADMPGVKKELYDYINNKENH